MGSCGSNQEKHCCHNHFKHEECHHHGEHDHGEEMEVDYFLELADEAWQEVLMDKIKAYILKTQNDRMDKLAKVIAEGNNHRWKNRMEKKQGCKDFMEELCKFFSHEKK